MAGTEVTIEWAGRPATAWVPEALETSPVPGIEDAATARLTERAAGAVVRVGDRLPAGWESPARLLLRAEGMASSNIEGVRAPAEAVASAQLGAGAGPAGWVADNLDVVREALTRPSAPLEISTLHAWHSRLMHLSSLTPELIGAFREGQSWIGGRSPHDAMFVPPPGRYVPDLMDDLVAYANRIDLDPVVQAAVLHAQFETIHPYGDGNGRIGRVLVMWILARRLGVAVPPPMSTAIARDIGGYLSGLYWFRAGEQTRWVRWFAEIVERSATSALEWIGDVQQVLARWREAVGGLRADAAGRRLLELLPAYPVITADAAARELHVSLTAARTALETLNQRGIVTPYVEASARPGRPVRLWVAGELMELVTDWAA